MDDSRVILLGEASVLVSAGIYSCLPANGARAAADQRAVSVYMRPPHPRRDRGPQAVRGQGAAGPCDMAAGPDYLHQLVDPQVINQNAARRFRA
jgi:hypothetical protein